MVNAVSKNRILERCLDCNANLRWKDDAAFIRQCPDCGLDHWSEDDGWYAGDERRKRPVPAEA